MTSQKILITGGPGVGKTTLLNALAERGYRCMPDSARTIIRQRREGGLSPRPPAPEFARGILRLDMDGYRAAEPDEAYVFFERGIPDALCFLDLLGLLSPAEAAAQLAAHPYFPIVFVLPPWQEVYCPDDERDQTFADCVRVHGQVLDWYARCGYDVVTVPHLPVAGRCEFVLAELDRHVRGA